MLNFTSTGLLCAPPSSFSISILQSAKRASELINGPNDDSLTDFLKSLVEESLPHRILYDDDDN